MYYKILKKSIFPSRETEIDRRKRHNHYQNKSKSEFPELTLMKADNGDYRKVV